MKNLIRHESEKTFAVHHMFILTMPTITIKSIQALSPQSCILQMRFTNPNLAQLKLEFEELSEASDTAFVQLPSGPIIIDFSDDFVSSEDLGIDVSEEEKVQEEDKHFI